MWTSLLAVACVTAADDTPLPEALAKHQLVRDGAYVVLPDEEKVHEEVAELKPRLRRLGELEKKSQAASDYENQKKQNVVQLRREHTELTDALANLPKETSPGTTNSSSASINLLLSSIDPIPTTKTRSNRLARSSNQPASKWSSPSARSARASTN